MSTSLDQLKATGTVSCVAITFNALDSVSYDLVKCMKLTLRIVEPPDCCV